MICRPLRRLPDCGRLFEGVLIILMLFPIITLALVHTFTGSLDTCRHITLQLVRRMPPPGRAYSRAGFFKELARAR
jgi:hypothetical protein